MDKETELWIRIEWKRRRGLYAERPPVETVIDIVKEAMTRVYGGTAPQSTSDSRAQCHIPGAAGEGGSQSGEQGTPCRRPPPN